MKPNIKIAIDELHRAFHAFNDKFYGGKLPEPAILIQNAGKRKLVAGWCTVNPIWEDVEGGKKYEINIVAEYLNRGTDKVLATLLHEMVHLYCRENDIKEVSRGNAYHNKTFKEIAESHGLENYKHDDRIGYSYTKLNTEAYTFIKNQLKPRENAFGLARMFLEMADGTPKKKKTNSYKYACRGCGTSVRATKQVYIGCLNPECECQGQLMEWVNKEDFEEPVVEVACKDCGSIHKVEYSKVSEFKCPDCDSDNIEVLGVAEDEEK